MISQGLVSLNRDHIVPFYIPSSMASIRHLYLNLYFPGLEDADYPDNSSLVRVPRHYSTSKTLRATNGSTPDNEFDEPKRKAGNSVGGGNYYWHRFFFKFDISPYQGFKLLTAELQWLLETRWSYGSGPNSQVSMILDAVGAFGGGNGILENGDWGLSSIQSFGVVQQYTDTIQTDYYKNIRSWLQDKLDAGTKDVYFRMKGETEPADASNGICYYTAGHQLYIQLAEDTEAAVSVYADNGQGFGSSIGSYSSDQEDIDLTSHFSGAGKKRLKFTCTRIRRIDVLLRLGVTLNKV